MTHDPSTSGHRQRLRQRFSKSGIHSLHDYEVVELLLTLIIPRKDVKPLAKSLIHKFGSLKNIFDAPPSDLLSIPGIGPSTPLSLQIIKDISSLYLQQHSENLPFLNNSDKLESFWISRLSNLKIEVFEIALLNNQLQLIKNGIHRISEGTFNHTVVYPRKIIEIAIQNSAAALVLAHNHPSGITQPSPQDLDLTQKLIAAAKVFDLKIIDHLIISHHHIFSFRRNHLIPL